eukprot:scaffold73_cov337-Pavlova_lutheri.AAC.35
MLRQASPRDNRWSTFERGTKAPPTHHAPATAKHSCDAPDRNTGIHGCERWGTGGRGGGARGRQEAGPGGRAAFPIGHRTREHKASTRNNSFN